MLLSITPCETPHKTPWNPLPHMCFVAPEFPLASPLASPYVSYVRIVGISHSPCSPGAMLQCMMSDSNDCMVTSLLPSTTQTNHVGIVHTSLDVAFLAITL